MMHFQGWRSRTVSNANFFLCCAVAIPLLTIIVAVSPLLIVADAVVSALQDNPTSPPFFSPEGLLPNVVPSEELGVDD